MIIVSWFTYALVSLFLYGCWGFFSKLATNYINPKSALIYDILGAIFVGLVFITVNNLEWRGDIRGVFYAVITGVTGTLATLFYLVAVSKGSSSIVLPLTSLYPAITVILAFFILKEPMTLRHGIGIILAIFAIILCAGD
ncbi:EamA family transporter [Chlorogloeopsis sp. ULAP01]|uniref:EamA family transporter n=1 Tax=Chlorogloeopsis sp. ULAP01 TaxID=3056483 RepID=UPI0025AB52A1|nr:EamA family transporter [Chlorogloeopsis sp. ULAP01]MDM9380586.1 EamA family transporter [Chlorogloeopsis sp. ULAP01]